MNVVWICALPAGLQRSALGGEDHGASHPVSWIVGHLPPPDGVHLHLACPWRGGDRIKTVEHAGVTLHLVPIPARGRAATLFLFDHLRYAPLVRTLRPDIVHGWGTEDSFAEIARRLAPHTHVASVQGVMTAINRHMHASPRYRLLATLERRTLRRSRHVAVESTATANMVRALGCPGEVRVVPQPLRPEFLAATPTRADRREVLFIGNLLPNKGYAEALHAFTAGAPGDWRLRAVGSGTAEAQADFFARARALGIHDRVTLEHGLDPAALIEILQGAPLLLLPTRIDSGPTALKEALALGVWPICFDNSGPGEFIRRVGAGSLVPDGKVTALGEALRRVIAEEPWRDAARQTGQVCRARELFSRETAWRELLSFYRDIAAGASPCAA